MVAEKLAQIQEISLRRLGNAIGLSETRLWQPSSSVFSRTLVGPLIWPLNSAHNCTQRSGSEDIVVIFLKIIIKKCFIPEKNNIGLTFL